MDAWQQTVEARLGELRSDTRGLVSDVGGLKADVAGLTAKVDTLPTKDWISATVRNWLAVAVALSALATFAANMLMKHG